MAAGHIVGLIGPNGAGKTTLFSCVSRLYTPNEGDLVFEGKSIVKDRRTSPTPRSASCTRTTTTVRTT